MKTEPGRLDRAKIWQQIMGITDCMGALAMDSRPQADVATLPLRIDVTFEPQFPTASQTQQELRKHSDRIARQGLDTSSYIHTLEETKRKLRDSYRAIVSGAISMEKSLGLPDDEHLRRICKAIELRYAQVEADVFEMFLRCEKRQNPIVLGSDNCHRRTDILQHAFLLNSSPNDKERDALAAKCGLTYKQVTTWFQNRRQRAKSDCSSLGTHASKGQIRLQESECSGQQASEKSCSTEVEGPSKFLGPPTNFMTAFASPPKCLSGSRYLRPLPALHHSVEAPITDVSQKRDASKYQRGSQRDQFSLVIPPASCKAHSLPVKPEIQHRPIVSIRASLSGPSRSIRKLPKRMPTSTRSDSDMSSSVRKRVVNTRIPSLTRSASSSSSSSHESPSEPRDKIQGPDATEVRETLYTRTSSGADQHRCNEISSQQPTSFNDFESIAAQSKGPLNSAHEACDSFCSRQESQTERTLTAHHSQPAYLPFNTSVTPIQNRQNQHVIMPKKLANTLMLPTNAPDNPVAQNHLQVDILPLDGTSLYDFAQAESLSLFPSLAPITSPDSKEANAPQQFHFDGLPFAFDDPPSQDFVLDDETLKEMEALFNLESVPSDVDASQPESNQNHDVAVEVPVKDFRGPYTADSSASEELMITPSKPPSADFLFTREDATVKHFEEQAVPVGKSYSSDANLVSLQSTGTASFASVEGQVMDFAHQMHDWESGLLPFDMPGAIEMWH